MRRVKIDEVFAAEIRAYQAPGFKAAAGNGDHDGLASRVGERAPAITLELNQGAGVIVRINVIDREDGRSVLLVGDLHHLRINLVTLFLRLKLNVEDQIFVWSDDDGRGVEVAIALERVLGFMEEFIGQGLEIGHKQAASCCNKS